MDTTPASNPKILAKVRALMAKAESTPFPAEAEALAAKAAELMAAYGVSAALLSAAGPVADDPIVSRDVHTLEPYARAKHQLLAACADVLSCVVVSLGSEATLWGHQSDVERVEFLFTALLLQAERMLAHVRPALDSRDGIRAYRRAWLLGFSTRIHERMCVAAKTATAATPGAALVLVSRTERVDQHMRANVDGPVGRSRSAAANRHGYHAGYEAGARADIGQSRVGGRRAIGA